MHMTKVPSSKVKVTLSLSNSYYMIVHWYFCPVHMFLAHLAQSARESLCEGAVYGVRRASSTINSNNISS